MPGAKPDPAMCPDTRLTDGVGKGQILTAQNNALFLLSLLTNKLR